MVKTKTKSQAGDHAEGKHREIFPKSMKIAVTMVEVLEVTPQPTVVYFSTRMYSNK